MMWKKEMEEQKSKVDLICICIVDQSLRRLVWLWYGSMPTCEIFCVWPSFAIVRIGCCN